MSETLEIQTRGMTIVVPYAPKTEKKQHFIYSFPILSAENVGGIYLEIN
jgi:hypothetical protein